MMLKIRLVICRNCGNQYSAENDACTHCGTAPYISRELRESIEDAANRAIYKTPQKGLSVQSKQRLRFFVPANPLPKERPRFGKGKTYTSKKTQEYEALVQHWANIAIQQQDYTMPDKDAPLMIILHFYREDKRGADADNLQKAIMDALNHTGAYADDKQILASIVTLERGTKRVAGTLVEIRPYYPDLSIVENLEVMGGGVVIQASEMD